MSWTLEEAITYYKKQGAPQDQTALINLLKEIQTEQGGAIPAYLLAAVAKGCGVKESFLQAVIKRIPSLRLEGGHLLELCRGPNCGKHRDLAVRAEQLCAAAGGAVTLKYGPCMRMCGKGPNLRWDGKLFHHADEALLRELFAKAK